MGLESKIMIVVDDKEAQLDTVSEFLRSKYTKHAVQGFTDPEEALQYYLNSAVVIF